MIYWLLLGVISGVNALGAGMSAFTPQSADKVRINLTVQRVSFQSDITIIVLVSSFRFI